MGKKPNLILCRALGCPNRRARRGASHRKAHEAEWHAIQREQRQLLASGTPIPAATLESLRARRFAMGMIWPPRSFTDRVWR